MRRYLKYEISADDSGKERLLFREVLDTGASVIERWQEATARLDCMREERPYPTIVAKIKT